MIATAVFDADVVDGGGRVAPPIGPLDGENAVLAQFSQAEVVHRPRGQPIEIGVVKHEA